MKRLTINRLAAAGFRTNRRAYFSLTAGLFLSIYLIAAVCLSVQGMALALREKVIRKMGSEDVIVYDCDLPDGRLREFGWFDQIGHVTVSGSAADGAVTIGSYDETAQELLGRRFAEGQMPSRAGEIAMEESALDTLELDASVGSTIELTITPVDGLVETRQYTLTGILKEQSEAMAWIRWGSFENDPVLKMPGVLLSGEEPPFASGRLVTQRVMTLLPGKKSEPLLRAWGKDPVLSVYEIAAISPYSGDLNTLYMYSGSTFFSTLVFCVILLGTGLLLVCGIGIAGAMESRLSRRMEQIGMLRAVGATSRQIRRIFGREAWLLAGLAAPPALLFACGSVALAARILPDTIRFRPSPRLLLPILGFSVALILLSAHIPLRRASRVMPMQVLRDTRLLKKLGRVKSRRQFSPAFLIAARQMGLHPGRLIAPGALIGLTMAILLLTVDLTQNVSRPDTQGDFYLRNYNSSSCEFAELIPERTLSEGDVAQLKALPQVGSVEVRRETSVVLPVPEESIYFREAESDPGYMSSPLSFPADYLELENGWQDGTDGLAGVVLDMARHQWAVQQITGEQKKLVNLPLYVMDLQEDALRSLVTEGKIDRAAIDGGEEVLAYLPDYYHWTDSDGIVHAMPFRMNRKFHLARRNDAFRAGEVLPVNQFLLPEEALRIQPEGQEEYLRLYEQADRREISVRLGAVLGGVLTEELELPCLITTPRGALAMGLDPGRITKANIWLKTSVDEETEERLNNRISGIAARGDMTVYNRLKSRRESRQEQVQVILTFLVISLVFLAAAAGLISGQIRRRILADLKSIGTLRAVGAGTDIIKRCYRTQMELAIAAGICFGCALSVLYYVSNAFPMTASPVWILFAEGTAVLAIWLACSLMLHRSVRAVAKKSIIENIREL